jgi:hypothetical protein
MRSETRDRSNESFEVQVRNKNDLIKCVIVI